MESEISSPFLEVRAEEGDRDTQLGEWNQLKAKRWGSQAELGVP